MPVSNTWLSFAVHLGERDTPVAGHLPISPVEAEVLVLLGDPATASPALGQLGGLCNGVQNGP